MVTSCIQPDLLQCDSLSFCDQASGTCQTCWEVCDPLRETPYICRQHVECADFWSGTTRSTRTETIDAAADSMLDLSVMFAVAIFIGVILLILLIAIVFLYRRGFLASFVKEDLIKCISCRNQSTPGRGPVVPNSDPEADEPLSTGVQEVGEILYCETNIYNERLLVTCSRQFRQTM